MNHLLNQRHSTTFVAIALMIPLVAAVFGPATQLAEASTSLTVYSNGAPTTTTVAGGTYTITATGTYAYALGVGNYADANEHWHGEAVPGHDTTCDDKPGDTHDLLINGVSLWGASCDSATHTYQTAYACSFSSCNLEFVIYDDYYNDNSGTLSVTIAASGPCADGIDNDGDGWVDYPSDPGCSGSNDATEGPNPQCSDGLDNDGDGWTDAPADAGCNDLRDDSEGSDPPPVCPINDGIVRFCLDPDTVVAAYTLHDSGVGPEHHVVGYLDVYRFTTPGGVSITIACVVLLHNGAPYNPCALAGGTYVSRLGTLVNEKTNEPSPMTGPSLGSVAICQGRLTLTVLGLGVESAPIVLAC